MQPFEEGRYAGMLGGETAADIRQMGESALALTGWPLFCG
jgi:hypothetical protein